MSVYAGRTIVDVHASCPGYPIGPLEVYAWSP